ncbi:MAG: hypothetical protein AAF772_15555, partial [Acidobacteriota bacterium]
MNHAEPTIIFLDQSRHSHGFDLEQSIWGPELSRVFAIIDEHWKSVNLHSRRDERDRRRRRRDDDKDRLTPAERAEDYLQPRTPERDEQALLDDRAPLSIAIVGSYGSGKSSLLKTLAKRVDDSDYPRYFVQPGKRRREYVPTLKTFPLIEPDRVEANDHFLYSFFARALELEVEHHSRQTGHHRGQSPQILTPVQQAFQKLSEYLQVLDDPQRGGEPDPLSQSLERLERHTSALRLQREMPNFIEQLVRSISADLLLLPVDDADLSLESLIATLQALNRYLRHPRLVPVFTFTGRMAEELMQTHIHSRLTNNGHGGEAARNFQEAATSLSIIESLAQQHLARLFPVRNRIRVGPAPARIQGAYYARRSEQNVGELMRNEKEHGVLELLQEASLLLFGCPTRPKSLPVRLPLRPSTLRRQLQVLDAMDSALRQQQHQDESWAVRFDRACWSLLNTHRDVLKETSLHLEDLYSWSPRNLRTVVLESILSQPASERRKLIKRWQYRTEDRRGQILGLL